jgi:hypothetical protein
MLAAENAPYSEWRLIAVVNPLRGLFAFGKPSGYAMAAACPRQFAQKRVGKAPA